MKRLFLIPLAFAALASCTQHEEGLVNNGPTGATETSYLSVSLISANKGTRAKDVEFEYGQDAENKVTDVTFLFFNESGAGVAVNTEQTQSWFKWTPEDDQPDRETGEPAGNIEGHIKATLVINTSAKHEDNSANEVVNSNVPSKIVAIVNAPNNLFSNDKVYSWNEVNEMQNDYLTNYTTAGKFIMTNSIYTKDYSTQEDAVSIAGFLRETPGEALANPVTIYVERVVAKVRMSLAESVSSTKQELAASEDDKVYYDDKDGKIYVKFLGWNVTEVAPEAYLMKHIVPTWSETLFGDDDIWSSGDYHRSYWAYNPTFAEGKTFLHNTFTSLIDGTPNTFTGSAETTTDNVYVQENAAQSSTDNYPETTTKVIIAAQLVDENEKPVTFAKWAGTEYRIPNKQDEPEKLDYSNLVNAILLSLESQNKYYYKRTGEVDSYTFTQISADDVEFLTISNVTEDDYSKTDDTTLNETYRYFVYAQLKSTAATADWVVYTKKVAEDSDQSDKDALKALTPLEDASDLNADLQNAGRAQIWNNGYTYYYFDIRHLYDGEEVEDYEDQLTTSAYFGVVRNHIYKCVINSVKGLGTPVYDPDEVIIPEKPEESYTYVAARIEILSWRVVDNDVDLEW